MVLVRRGEQGDGWFPAGWLAGCPVPQPYTLALDARVYVCLCVYSVMRRDGLVVVVVVVRRRRRKRKDKSTRLDIEIGRSEGLER